jgi:hypothetical protein
MTIASDAVVEACWPEGIPRDYKELYKMYAPFVATVLRRHNKVRRNFEEMYAFVWKRLVEKDVIRLFMESVEEKLPKQLTAVEACEFFGIGWKQWEVKQWGYHVGYPIKSKHNPKVTIGRRMGGWMPTPINDDDFIAKSRARNAKRAARGLPPLPESNGCQAKTAIYNINDIVKLSMMERLLNSGAVEGPFRKQGEIKPLEIKATKAHFQAYLSRSIHSDWHNWCRTYRRKWAQDRPMFQRSDDEHESDFWEKLVDPAGAKQETNAVLKEAVTRLSTTLHQEMRDVNPSERKPIAQTEMQMFELLERGVPLTEALKKLDVPEKVRRAVLLSISDIRFRAA